MPLEIHRLAALLCLLVVSLPIEAGDSLGRLLTSPEERRLIAAARSGALEQEQNLVRFDGAVAVAGGGFVAWVDGIRIERHGELERRGLSLVLDRGPSPSLAVLGSDGRLHYLLPGQSFDRNGNRVLQPWETGDRQLAAQSARPPGEVPMEP